MQKILAYNQNNQMLEIEIIRYFEKDEKRYLIFTLGEKDNQGYIKVYVSKILGLNGTLAAYDIIDQTEWNSVKELVKKIIKANREGEVLDIVDLPLDYLANIKINGQQVFKLIDNLIELLGSNVKESKVEKIIPTSDTNIMSDITTNEASTTNTSENDSNTTVEIQIQPEPVSSEKEKSVSTETENSVNYKQLYQELFDKYQNIITENSKLKTQLANIKSIIGE